MSIITGNEPIVERTAFCFIYFMYWLYASSRIGKKKRMKLMMIILNKLKAKRKNYIIIYYPTVKRICMITERPTTIWYYKMCCSKVVCIIIQLCVFHHEILYGSHLMEVFIISCLTGFEFAEWGKVKNVKRKKKVTQDRKCFVWAKQANFVLSYR